jgi:hypothetical protein
MRKGFDRIKGDERILGDGAFVESVLAAAQEDSKKNRFRPLEEKE